MFDQIAIQIQQAHAAGTPGVLYFEEQRPAIFAPVNEMRDGFIIFRDTTTATSQPEAIVALDAFQSFQSWETAAETLLQQLASDGGVESVSEETAAMAAVVAEAEDSELSQIEIDAWAMEVARGIVEPDD